MGYAPELKDKMICASFYTGVFFPFLMPWVPVIWIIVANLRKIHLKDFVKYHCYQAVLLNMVFFALPKILTLLANFIANLLSITVILEKSAIFIQSFVVYGLSIYFILIKVISIYAVIWTARGRFTYLPPISQAVNLLLR